MKHTGGGNSRGRRATFGSVRKLPSGRWQARYTGPDGREHRAEHTFTTKTDANAWLGTRYADITRDDWKAERPRREGITFAEFVKPWVENRRTKDGEPLKPRTRDHYNRLLERVLLPAFGDLRVTDITVEHVEQWRTDMGVKTPTLRAHSYSLLQTILADAVQAQHLKANPCVIQGAGTSRRRKKIKPATLSELAAIVEHMPERLRALVLVCAWCALRFGEATELRRADLDLDTERRRGLIHVERGVTRVSGEFVVGDPKSDAGKRTVAVPPHLVPLLQDHLDRHVGRGKNALLFPAADGRTHLQPSSLYRSYYPAREAAGRPDLRWHDLRHTGAVFAAQTGATLAELMERLGHATPAAALRYQHSAEGRDAKIAAALSKIAEGEK
ncbi:integrase-like protein [Barrientosiimonas humi]|uniref:Integrase-like protein n=1 Tax=Barrientosiimonas humi TaxID=999931 RepID=A0A542XBJ4_9MICO|nr:integrase-like protein [Barrientosiimonas humi]CAG7573201.1 Putative prophage phiRv2 integrase [Barrientosiimonas humi]